MGCASLSIGSGSDSIPQQHLTRLKLISQISHQLNINKKYQYLAKINLDFKTGTGIKKTHTYDCLSTKEQLMIKRREFWETRTNGNHQTWSIVNRAVNELEQPEILELFKRHRIYMINNSIQLCVDLKTNSFNKYEVPIFCINQPQSYSSQKIGDQNLLMQYEDKLLQVKVRSVKFPNQDIELKQQASTDIQIIINTLRAMKQIPSDQTIRMFYNGRELNPNKTLGNYNFQSGHIMQAMIK